MDMHAFKGRATGARIRKKKSAVGRISEEANPAKIKNKNSRCNESLTKAQTDDLNSCNSVTNAAFQIERHCKVSHFL